MSTTREATFADRFNRVLMERNAANVDYESYGRNEDDYRAAVKAERELEEAIRVANDAVALCRTLLADPGSYAIRRARETYMHEAPGLFQAIESVVRRADMVGTA